VSISRPTVPPLAAFTSRKCLLTTLIIFSIIIIIIISSSSSSSSGGGGGCGCGTTCTAGNAATSDEMLFQRTITETP